MGSVPFIRNALRGLAGRRLNSRDPGRELGLNVVWRNQMLARDGGGQTALTENLVAVLSRSVHSSTRDVTAPI